MAATSSFRSHWIVDSGAAVHVTPKCESLNHSAPCEGNMQIMVANGTRLPVTHTGTSNISNNILLRDVRVVPNVIGKLLSVSKLTMDHPVDVLFSQPFFTIHDRKTKKVLAKGRCENGLYILKDDHEPQSLINATKYGVISSELAKRSIKLEDIIATIKVARDANLHEQIGKNIVFDLVDHDKVHSFRVHKLIPFNLFKEEVAKQFGIPVKYQRFWLWEKRSNRTYRPSRILTSQEEALPVHKLQELLLKAPNDELKLFLEVEIGQGSLPVPPPAKTKNEILLFFKLYDPSKEELRYVGRLFVKVTGKSKEIVTKLNEMAGFDPKQEIQLFEEIKFEPTVICEHIDQNVTYRTNQFIDGDIICFQKRLWAGTFKYRYPDVPSFLEHVRNG